MEPLRIGCVSFFNSKPLIYGLEKEPGVRLELDVPSRLLAGLAEKRFDVALLPVIDYQRLAGLTLIPAGGIGCDGPTLTPVVEQAMKRMDMCRGLESAVHRSAFTVPLPAVSSFCRAMKWMASSAGGRDHDSGDI